MSLPSRPWLAKLAASVVLVAVAASGCSLVVDASAAQCQRDSDCARFGGAICDSARQLCVPQPPDEAGGHEDPPDAAAAADADAERDAPGALLCAPDGSAVPGTELLNACTDATCIPFDNRQRLRNLLGDGTLPPLPDLPAVRP